jgi:hypothetical protein
LKRLQESGIRGEFHPFLTCVNLHRTTESIEQSSGQSPDAAWRAAMLASIRSTGNTRKYYWARLQVYGH